MIFNDTYLFNDTHTLVKNECTFDTSILGTGSSAVPLYKSIQTDVNKLTNWLNTNKLGINATKTVLVEFQNSQKINQDCTIDINLNI